MFSLPVDVCAVDISTKRSLLELMVAHAFESILCVCSWGIRSMLQNMLLFSHIHASSSSLRENLTCCGPESACLEDTIAKCEKQQIYFLLLSSQCSKSFGSFYVKFQYVRDNSRRFFLPFILTASSGFCVPFQQFQVTLEFVYHQGITATEYFGCQIKNFKGEEENSLHRNPGQFIKYLEIKLAGPQIILIYESVRKVIKVHLSYFYVCFCFILYLLFATVGGREVGCLNLWLISERQIQCYSELPCHTVMFFFCVRYCPFRGMLLGTKLLAKGLNSSFENLS